jgi:hypothetical protein
MYDFLIDIIPREDVRVPEYQQHPHPASATGTTSDLSILISICLSFSVCLSVCLSVFVSSRVTLPSFDHLSPCLPSWSSAYCPYPHIRPLQLRHPVN